MQNSKTGGSRWVPDIRPENIDTYTEQDGGQSTQYKIVDAHPIIGGVLDRLAFFRTHASAVWYNKMKNITVLQKIDNLAANIGTLAQLATTDKTSLVNAINELNVNMTLASFIGGTGSSTTHTFYFSVFQSTVRSPILVIIGSQNDNQTVMLPITLTGGNRALAPSSLPEGITGVSGENGACTITSSYGSKWANIMIIYDKRFVTIRS